MSRTIAKWMALAALTAGAAWGQITPNCTPATLPQLIGTAVSITCAPTGGTGPYTWSISAGALPPGLTPDSGTGNITGTLTDPAGPYSFTVMATDTVAPNATGSQTYTGTTVDLLTISCAPGGPVEADVPYSATCTAGGGTQAYTWSIVGTLVPPGMTITPASATTATVSFTPAAAMASYQYHVHLTDSTSPALSVDSGVYTGAIAPAVTITTTSPLPAAVVGTAYSRAFAEGGGVALFSWSAAGLPAWLTMSAGGLLTGTPPAAGSVSFTATVTDGAGGVDTLPFVLPVNAALTITTTSPLPAATIGAAYSQTFSAAGGSGGYAWSATGLPSWLSLSAAGALTGTPPATAVNSSFTVTVTDSSNASTNALFTVPVNLVITTASPLPNGTVGVNYSQTLAAGGGAPPYTWSIPSGSSPPAGISLSPTGVLSGIPSSFQTLPFNFTAQAKDSNSVIASKSFAVTIAPPLTITTAPTLPTATVGALYSQTLAATGGTPPYTWALAAGSSLPGGLTLSSGGVIGGTPTAAPTPTAFTVQVTDNNLVVTATKAFSLTIAPALSITTASPLPSGEVGVAYSQTLAASGGTSPYIWSISAGGLPAGLALSAGGAIGGTPNALGTFAFTAVVTDSNSVASSKPFTLTIAAPVGISTPATLDGGSVGSSYSQTLVAANGLPPYTWSLAAGALPGGLTLSSAGALTGSPTAAGTFNFTAQVTDSLSAAASRQFTVVIAAGLAVASPANLPGAAAGAAYLQQIQASGGSPPYTWALTSGSLPAGLSLAPTGALSGTPAAVGSFQFTVQVADSASNQASKQLSLTVASALTITTAPLPDGAPGVSYAQSLAVTGGTPPYSWSLSSGSLPPGLALSVGGAITGKPGSAGVFPFTVQVADSLGVTATAQLRITVVASLTISTASLGVGSVGSTYRQTLAAIGGTPPDTWTVTSGSLPPGLALSSSGTISGIPTTPGNFTFTVQVADSASVTATKQFTLAIVAVTITTTSPLPGGSAGASYSQTLTAAGGTPPYTWVVTTGTLPSGLTLDAAGTLAGTPSSSGTFTFTVQVTDSAPAPVKASQQFTLVIAGNLAITTASLPNGSAGVAYSQTLAASGGAAPYTWSITGGTLPAGLTLAGGGALTGTPSGAGTFSFTVQVTDHASATATRQLTLLIAGITTPSALPNAAVGVAYSQALVLSGGAPPYGWSIVQGALPAGLSLDTADGKISGTPTAAGNFTVTVQVTDSTPTSYSGQFTLAVLPVPAASFSGVQPTATPATQMNIGLALSSAYASDIAGTVTLTFQPDATLTSPTDDPSIQFSKGGRTVSFNITAGSTAPVSFSLQTGTVAGTISLSVTWQVGNVALGVPDGLHQTIKIAPSAPVITNVAATTTSSGFQVQVTAYSTTREVTQAAVHFTAAAGQTLQTTDVTVPLTTAATAWFQNSTSAQYGSQFILTLPFTVTNGAASAIGSVSVTLTNSAGTSNSMGGSL